MSLNPFRPDPAVPARLMALEATCAAAVREAVSRGLVESERNVAENLGGVLPKKAASAICAAHGVNADELLLLSLGEARRFARPPISNFHVGAIGREVATGNLVFGGNLEFSGAHIGNTVHGEGFVFTRAFSRGTTIETLAIREAHPCAHCRQYLSEFAAAQNLVLIDPLGHRLRMADLYPWPFDPDYLGERGIVGGATPHPHLELEPNDLPTGTAAALTLLGRRSYTPYGKAPAALVFTLRDGALIGGPAIESVSFNPTISPIQAAMIDLYAHGYGESDIVDAVIATRRDAQVDYILHTVDALAAIAPGVRVRMLRWA